MALFQSRRSRHGFELDQPNMTPMMNLMVVLIPLLLTSAEFVRLGVIELNLPPAAAGPEGKELAGLPVETFQKLDLSVTITDQGFFISSALAVLRDHAGGPTLSLQNGRYPFAELSETLYEVKQKAEGQYPDTEQIVLLAEPEVDYQTIVSTMDASRMFRKNGELIILFPEVSLSAGIL